jgi:hypothetical protein
VAIVTGDYFLDDAVSNELQELGAELRFKPSARISSDSLATSSGDTDRLG